MDLSNLNTSDILEKAKKTKTLAVSINEDIGKLPREKKNKKKFKAFLLFETQKCGLFVLLNHSYLLHIIFMQKNFKSTNIPKSKK